ASGTYMTRAGNAADRALLLAELLGRKGVTTRFALGTLDASSEDRLFNRTFEFPTRGPPPPLPTDNSGFSDRLFQRASHDYEIARQALGDRLEPVTKPSRHDVEAEMNPHVWVQAEIGGAWVDLDPSFANMKPGMHVATVDSTPLQLPDALYQRLTIRVRKENVIAGQLVNTT